MLNKQVVCVSLGVTSDNFNHFGLVLEKQDVVVGLVEIDEDNESEATKVIID